MRTASYAAIVVLVALIGCTKSPSRAPRQPEPATSLPANTAAPPPAVTSTSESPAAPFIDLATDLLKAGKAEEAVVQLKQATLAAPRSKHAWNDLAFAYLKLEQPGQAIEAARTAVQLDPHFAAAQFNLGLAYLRSARPEEALPHLEASYRLNTAQIEPGWFYAQAYEHLGKTSKARAIYQQLASRFPSDPDLPSALARTLPITWEVPTTAKKWWIHPEWLIVLDQDQRAISAFGRDGTARWRLKASEPVKNIDLSPDGRHLAVQMGQQIRLLSTAQGNWIGSPLSTHDGATLHFVGRMILVGHDVWGLNMARNPKWLHTEWRAYSNDGKWTELLEPIHRGREFASSTDGRVLLMSGRDVLPYTLYVDGKEERQIRLTEGRFGLLPDGAHLLHRSSSGRLSLLDIKGQELWHVSAPDPSSDAILRTVTWDHKGQPYLVVTGFDRYLILTRDGKVVADQPGQAVRVVGSYLQVRVDREYRLVDIQGRLVARYGEGEAIDSQGPDLLAIVVENRIEVYLPD